MMKFSQWVIKLAYLLFVRWLPFLAILSFLSFALIRLVPGDPVLLLLGERGSDPAIYKEMQDKLGLNLPYYQQYLNYLKQLLTGDLGISIVSKRPVWEEFLSRFPATVELSLLGMSFAVFFGIPFGIIAALKRGKWQDTVVMISGLIGYSMPIFWWGLLAIMFFSVYLGIMPVSGRLTPWYIVPHVTGLYLIDTWFSSEPFTYFLDALHHLLLPSIVMGTIPLAVISRMTRSSLLEVLGEDYIRTAKAKGLSFKRLIIHHALRNALIPIATVTGLMLGTLLTGAILTETLFAWPGIGKWIVASINARDYPVIQAALFLIGAMMMTLNESMEIMYRWLNPKLRK
jgi:dipeptide transport system permease protein